MSDLTQRLAQLSPEQRARLADRVAAARASELPDNAIAIVGMGCRLPGHANSPAAFWDLLVRGVDAVTAVPTDRWDGDAFFDTDPDAPGKIATREGAFIDGVADFDAAYFSISPFEARQMDPQQRLFLEVAMEALENAGLTREQLAGSMCGVFVGVHSHSSEYYAMQAATLEGIDTFTSTGTAHSVLANRLSYFLDLRGPSMAIDTACSSSLVALHQACLSLRAGESTVAIAGGLNLMLSPDFNVALSKLRVLSSGGRCRTFDVSADGIARGEGCGVVVLKRAADAVRDGDPILAIVRGSAVNQDGATNGLTAPSTPSQIAVIRAALATAKLDPNRVSFVETHGTGTSLGDPIEVEAIAATYGAPRPTGEQVVLGALKTNIGHLEGAAGVTSIIKTVLCLQHRHIPKNLHFNTLNPLVRLDGTSIALATRAQEWKAVGGTRIGAVSSFGFGGTNAHVILEQAPSEVASVTAPDAPTLPLVLSAQTPEALLALASQWAAALRTSLAEVAMHDLAFTAAVRRSHHACRVAVTGDKTAEWADRLDAWARMREHDTLPPLGAGKRRKIAFVFCGQGPQWFAMGRELFAAEPRFRDELERVSAVVQRVAGWNLLDELARDEATSRIHETGITQPAIFAIQMGLVTLWRAWGVEPDFVIGHSMGEIAAACTAGALDLEEGARIAVFRGRAVSQAEGLGSMIAFPITAAAATRAIAGLESRVGIAAINAPSSVVLAGDAASLATVSSRLNASGVEGRTLEVRYASHSPQMEPLVSWLRDSLGQVTHTVPSLPMFSSISHGLVTRAMLDAEHWGAGLRRSVDFSGGVNAALDAGCRTFIDIAPHPVMAGYVRECAEAAGVDVVAVASLRRTAGERAQLMQSLGELYVAGVNPTWNAVPGGSGKVVELPGYPWQHQRYWIADTQARRPAMHALTSRPGELHTLAWVAAGPVAPASDDPVRAWIVLGGDAAFAAALSTRLGCGDVTARAVPGESVRDAIAMAFTLGGDIIDLRATEVSGADQLFAHAVRHTSALQSLLAAVSERNTSSTTPVRVWCVTRGAQLTSAPDAAQAAVWGLGRVAAAELPASWGGMVDLDPSAAESQHIDDLMHAVAAHATEYESAFRAGQRLVPRLQALSISATAPALRVDGAYLVTGGLGGVGLVVAEWLAANGARRIVLAGRTPLPAREQWDDAERTTEERRRIAGVRQIEARGAEVFTAALDASDTEGLRRMATELHAAGWGSVRGILHCATDVQFGLLTDVVPESVAAMMRSKLAVAEALLEVFGPDAPDFYVMFSSMGALLGERGQGTYAAANATLDAWSLARRSDGVPMSVINWGAWADTGLAATRGGELVNDGLRLRGVFPVAPQAATAALGAVITHQLPMAVVFRNQPVDTVVNGRDPWSMLSGLQRATADSTAVVTRSARDEIFAESGVRERMARLTSIVRDVIADTLGITDSRIDVERPLGTLGMDSLMAIRIRRRCERLFDITLPATALFSYPTIAAFVQFLSERLGVADAPAVIGQPTASEAATEDMLVSAIPALDSLSDDDALAALRTRRVPKRSAS